MSWAWWDWSLTWLTNHRSSVLWHCWLGHVTRKIVSEMTYNVSSGTLNSTIPYHLLTVLLPTVCWIQVGYVNYAIFDQFVGNNTRYGHGYCRMVIGNHIRCIEPWHFQWPWVTSEGHFDDLFTVVTLSAQLTCNLLAIAKFLVLIYRS